MYILQTKGWLGTGWIDTNQSENLEELVGKAQQLLSTGTAHNNIQILKKVDFKVTTTIETGE
jgi:hypothetical protein